ncbi:hypothetical protein BC826DRAFT_1184617 [Russula brevipes]|nr:hypothetical protein BC826DRAFT_1184617 [Russula brevipes]
MSSGSNPRNVIVLSYGGRHVAVLRSRCSSFQDLLAVVRSTFSLMPEVYRADLIVIRAMLPEHGILSVELSAGTWEAVCASLSRVEVAVNHDHFDDYD